MHHAHKHGFITLVFITLLNTGVAYANASFQGVAREPGSGEFNYREIHCAGSVNRNSRTLPPGPPLAEKVKYLNKRDEPIATKRLHENFQFSPELQQDAAPAGVNPAWVPEYEFEHHATGFAEALRYSGDQVRLYRRETREAQWESKPINASEYDTPLIADAGFDLFVRDHLQQLVEGESLDVTYLSAPRLDTLGFRLDPKKQDKTSISIDMYPSNFVIRLLVDPIRVVYSKSSGRLIRFKGLTNVPRNQDENFVASIDYQYGENLNAFCR